MCIPALPAIGMGLSLLGSAGNMANSMATYEYQKEISERNAKLAKRAANSQYSQLGEKYYQEGVGLAAEGEKAAADANAARSRVNAAAAEAGVSGNSVEALLADFSRQEGNYLTALDTQRSFQKSELHYAKQGVRSGLEARLINAAPPARPDFFGQALGAFSNAFSSGLQLDQVSYSHGGNTLFI